jgi:hypothetical protein
MTSTKTAARPELAGLAQIVERLRLLEQRPPGRPGFDGAPGRDGRDGIGAAELAGVLRAVNELAQRVDALEQHAARQGPRDREDAQLLHTLATATQGLPFRTADLLHHARVEPTLRPALDAATVRGVHELGCWLRRMAGCHAGVVVERLPRRHWRIRDISHT